MFNKRDIKLGGEGRIFEIDESLFIRVKHNRGRDMRRKNGWSSQVNRDGWQIYLATIRAIKDYY
jgi:hypothetical protein